MVPFSLFILSSYVCKSLWCLISALRHRGKGGHVFSCSCWVVLWGEKNTAKKYHWRVRGMLAVYGAHGVCPSSQWRVLSQSTLLRLQVALQRNCPKWALGFVHFPGLSHSGSGSWVLHKGTDSVWHVLGALPSLFFYGTLFYKSTYFISLEFLYIPL